MRPFAFSLTPNPVIAADGMIGGNEGDGVTGAGAVADPLQEGADVAPRHEGLAGGLVGEHERTLAEVGQALLAVAGAVAEVGTGGLDDRWADREEANVARVRLRSEGFERGMRLNVLGVFPLEFD